MYAICDLGGRQIKVEPDRILRVDYRTDAEPGSKIVLDKILLVSDGGKIKIGTPHVTGKVHATVVEHGRDDKIVVYRKIRRKEYHKMRGHKQLFTKIKVDKIEV